MSFKISIVDKNGDFVPNFRVCIVAGGGQANWPLPWTKVPDHGPLTVTPDSTKPGDILYVQGPGNLKQPDLVNYSTFLRINRIKQENILLQMLDCEKIACAPCSEVLASHPTTKEEDTIDQLSGNIPNLVESHVYDCAEIQVQTVNKAGVPVSGYLGQIRHQEPGPYLTEVFDIGTGKSVFIRKAQHAVWVYVWKAGTSQSLGQKEQISPDQSTVFVPFTVKGPPQHGTELVDVHLSGFNNVVPYTNKKHEATSGAVREKNKQAIAAGREWLAREHPDALHKRVLALYDKDRGLYFQLSSHLDYAWGAFAWDGETLLDGSRINEECKITHVLVEWVD